MTKPISLPVEFNISLRCGLRVKACQNVIVFLSEAVGGNSNQNFVKMEIGANNEIIAIREGLDGTVDSTGAYRSVRWMESQFC